MSNIDSKKKQELEAYLGEYISDPFNCINVMVASAVNMAVPLIGELNTVRILSGYLGTVIASMVNTSEDRKAVLETVEAIRDELAAAVNGLDLDDSDAGDGSDDDSGKGPLVN